MQVIIIITLITTIIAKLVKNVKIGDDGCTALVKHVLEPSSSALSVLNLGDNGISKVGGATLAGAFPSNKTMTLMDLDGNSIADEDSETIFRACADNKFRFDL